MIVINNKLIYEPPINCFNKSPFYKFDYLKKLKLPI